ncbi:hypothetical protein DFH06DRAFT_1481209 [Mycena polygramma]|nr:hypothetical protein DFH06DRAFT_1481209 [Mycena polygramma]
MPVVPAALFLLPMSTYGISYDISTRPTEDDAPAGWNAPRSPTYGHMKRRLTTRGFTRDQYWDWLCPNTTAHQAFIAMVLLETIPPPHKFSSTVRRLRMARHDALQHMEVTANIQLGGVWVNHLRGPVPSGLVAPVANLLNPAPVPGVPPGTVLPPTNSRAGGASLPGNFMS